jgi:hypothetical protein
MSPSEDTLDAYGEFMLKFAGAEFPGLTGHSAVIHEVFSGEGRVCVVWTLKATHGEAAKVGGPFPGVEPFLGWQPTGRDVAIPVVSIARLLEHGLSTDWHHQWDRLGALAQIGVRAVGRPVLRTNSPVDR